MTTRENSSVTADQIFFDARTAVRFQDEHIDSSVVDSIYDTIKFGPTAMNGVPLRLTVVESAAERDALIERMNPGNREKTASAPILVVVSANIDWHETLTRTAPFMENPVEMFKDAEEMRRSSARTNGALQMGYFILAARATGLDVAPMTGYDAAAVTEHFLPSGREELLAVIALGHRDVELDFPRMPRLAAEEAVRHA